LDERKDILKYQYHRLSEVQFAKEERNLQKGNISGGKVFTKEFF
jgi:hypothetical protein